MNEQNNNNLTTGVAQTNPALQPATQPVQTQQPVVQQPVEATVSPDATAGAAQPVQMTEAAAVTQQVTPGVVQPVAQPVNQVPPTAPPVAPIQQPVDVNNTQAPVMQGVSEQPVQQTVQPVETPVAAPTPTMETAQPQTQVVNQVAQPQVQQPVAPVNTQVAQTNIVAQEPLNPLANNQTNTMPANNGVIAPSTPLTPTQPMGGAVNSNGVGFVAASAPPKKKANKPLIFGIVFGVLVVIGLLGYFVIYPFVVDKFFSDPKNVYETAIRNVFKEVNTTVTEVVHSKAIYDVKLSLDSNLDVLQSYTGYTYGFNVGVDPVEEAIQAGFTIADNASNAAHTYNTYLKDGKEYIKYSTERELIYAGEADLEAAGELFGSFQEMLTVAENSNSEDVNYLVNKLADLLVGSLDESKLSKEEASLNINGETVKVVNNKYLIDQATVKNTMTYVFDGLKNDDEALRILAEMLGMEETAVKELLTYTEEENEEVNDEVITMSIYTTTGLKATVVGYGFTTNKNNSEVHYYSVENYFEFKAYIVSMNVETNKEDEYNFEIIGRTTNGKTTVSISYNDEELATLNVKDWTDEVKEFDYNIVLGENAVATGTVKFTSSIDEKMNKYGLEASFRLGDDYVNVTLTFSEDWTSEVARINVNEAVTKSDDQINEIHTQFMNLILSTPVGELFQTVSGDVSEDIYYEIDGDYDEYEEYDNSVIQDEYEYEDESIITIE